jgi:V/A-type H+-transporting ATPase subunit I
MKKVSIIVHEKYSDSLVSTLHESGIVEVTDTSKLDRIPKNLLTSPKSSNISADCASLALRISRILDVFEQAKPEPQGLVKSFTEPQKPIMHMVNERGINEIIKDAETVLKQIESSVLNIENELNEIKERSAVLKHQQSQIEALLPLKFDLRHLGISEHLVIKAGTVDDIGLLHHNLKDVKNTVIKSAKIDGFYSVIIISHLDQKEELENKLRGRFFTEFEITNKKGMPSEVLESIISVQKKNTIRENILLKKLQIYRSDWYLKLITLEEELLIEKSRKDIITKFGKTDRTHVITGWVAKKLVNRLNRICEQSTNGHVSVHYEDPKNNPEPEAVPIRYDNPTWAKPFEHLIKMYSPPRYNEFDPTMIIALPFLLFFGLMLGDAGYGLVILIFCIYGYFHVGKVRPYVKIASYIGILMGISTIFFGIIMGTFFGDLVPRLIYDNPELPLYEATVLGYHLPYDPIRSPLILLQVSLIIGLIYVTMSIVVAAAQNIRNKEYRNLVLDQISWFILIPSGLILVFEVIFHVEFSDTIYYLAVVGTLVGIVLIFIQKFMLFFFDITGYLGDVLSFARLLALGMATAGIAMAINVIGALMPPFLACATALIFGIILIKFWEQMELKIMMYIGYFLFVLGILGFIGIAVNDPVTSYLVTIGVGAGIATLLAFAHLINFVLQALGAGVHSLRLQYVEFFGRCYEGGGNMFRPFSSARQYTRLRSRR